VLANNYGLNFVGDSYCFCLTIRTPLPEFDGYSTLPKLFILKFRLLMPAKFKFWTAETLFTGEVIEPLLEPVMC